MKYNRPGYKATRLKNAPLLWQQHSHSKKRDAINKGSREGVWQKREEGQAKKDRATQEATFEKAGGKAQHKADNTRLNSNNGKWDWSGNPVSAIHSN